MTALASYGAFSCLSQQFSAIIYMHDKDPRPPPDSAYHAGAEFLIYGDNPLKLHKSYTNQVSLL